MTKPKHTQGPWHVDGDMVFAANTLRIADCFCDDQPDLTEDEIKANTRLIAAAPRLLAEAIKTVAAMKKAGTSFNESGLAEAIKAAST